MFKKRKHWFCFTFSDMRDSNQVIACTYTGYDCKNININRINDNKAHAGVSPSAVLMGISYLGYMTKDDFQETDKQT